MSKNESGAIEPVVANKRAYLNQAGAVSELLMAAEKSLTDRSPEAIAQLEAALDRFETVTAPVVYGVDDVPDILNKLSVEEKLDVLDVFASNYECNDADWEALNRAANITHGGTKLGWGLHVGDTKAAQLEVGVDPSRPKADPVGTSVLNLHRA